MSHTLRTLAKLDAFHTVACCTHEAIHLNWGNVSVHIPLAQFVGLAGLLQHVHIGRAGQDLANTVCRISQDQSGNVQLRLPDLSLFFRPRDFLQFASLVEEALLVLGEDVATADFGFPTGPALAVPEATSYGRYRSSLN
jgi:hypothetical protein